MWPMHSGGNALVTNKTVHRWELPWGQEINGCFMLFQYDINCEILDVGIGKN